MFWFVCRKIGLFPAILHRKMFSASLQRVTLIFTWFYSKQTFPFIFGLSYAVFRIHVWRNSLYLFSYINCAVNPLSYRKHVLGFWQLQWKLRTLAHKKKKAAFRCKIRCFNLHSNENMFWFVGNKIRLLWSLYHKKQRFCFLWRKTL